MPPASASSQSSAKLAALGQLTAQLTHELGNHLGTMLGYVAILSDKTQEREHPAILKRLEQEIIGLSNLTKSLLGLVRPPTTPAAPIEIGDLTRKTVSETLNPKLMKNVSFDYEFRQPYHVRLDPGELQQVVLNLLINACHAVATKIPKATVRLKSYLNDDNQVVLEISDNGIGIPVDKQQKIFEPFFTTKPLGQGTGLGLYIAMTVIEAARGTISVESTPGEGATFRITLPKA